MAEFRSVEAKVDIPAFLLALFLSPLVVAGVFSWLVFPVAALGFGAQPYLVFGTPVLFWMATRYPLGFRQFAVGGLVAHAIFCFFLIVWRQLDPTPALQERSFLFLALWGIPFSAIWSGTFAEFYRFFVQFKPS